MLERLLALLTKVSMYKKPCRIEIDYDGSGPSGFKWKVPLTNLTAEEYNPTADKHERH
jgi:hypothetical protein